METGWYWVRNKKAKILEIAFYNSESYDKHDCFVPWTCVFTNMSFSEDYFEVVEKVKLPESK